MNTKNYTFIDIFCGIGGFSYGFEEADFVLKLAIDNNLKLKETFNKNHNRSVFRQYDLSKETINKLNDLKVDLFIGSPPCQGFSDARGCRIIKKKKDLLRNSLSFAFLKLVEYFQPKIVLLENVKGLSTYKLNGCLLLNKILEEFDKLNYNICFNILNALDFGIPQNRERIFFLAVHKEFKITPILNTKIILQSVKTYKPTLRDVFTDLPLDVDNQNYLKNYDEATPYQKMMRDKKNDKLYNHNILSYPNEKELELIQNLPQGKEYRSSRFGKKYIGVWDLYKAQLLQDERELFYFLCKKRTLNEFKELKKKYQEGYIRIEKFPINKKGKFQCEFFEKNSEENTNRTPQKIIDGLIEKGFIRKRAFMEGNNPYYAYDINTKSGIRPKYRRLSYEGQSSTIQTVSFKVNDLIHPVANRPLTFREGARIQSFPDSFVFYGSKINIASMIGNAVPPLMAYHLGLYIYSLLDYIAGKKESINVISKKIKISS
ncbi:hypothetical protein ES707_22500 [subsurface metagenome]